MTILHSPASPKSTMLLMTRIPSLEGLPCGRLAQGAACRCGLRTEAVAFFDAGDCFVATAPRNDGFGCHSAQSGALCRGSSRKASLAQAGCLVDRTEPSL
jgi:hypothetical protein